MRARAFLFVTGLVALLAVARAETLLLANGQKLEGRVVGQTSTTVDVATQLGVVRIARSQIRSIETTSDPLNDQIVSIKVALAAGRTLEAFQQLDQLHDAGPAQEQEMDSVIVRHWDAVDATGRDAPALILAPIQRYLDRRKTAPSAELLCKAVELTCSAGDTSSVQTLLKTAAARQWLRPAVAEKLVAILRDSPAFEASTPAQMLPIISVVMPAAAEDTSTETAVVKDLWSLLIESHSSASEVEWARSVAEGLRELLPQCPEEWRSTLARMAIHEAETRGSSEALCMLCAQIEDLVLNGGMAGGLAEVALDHVRVLTENGQFAEARAVAKRIEPRFPDLAAEFLVRIDFAAQKAALAPDDDAGRYRLAKWACRMGLQKEAVGEFRALVSSPTVGNAARLQIEAIEMQQDAAALDAALQFYQQGLYAAAAQRLATFTRERGSSKLTTEAAVLLSLAELMAKKMPETQRQRSFSLVQQAERLAMQRRAAEAAALLQQATELDPSSETRADVARLVQRFPLLRAAMEHTR